MNPLTLIVAGTPAPQGSKRHVGGGRMIESSKAVAPWREAIKWTCLAKKVGCFDGPVAVEITFTVRKPASAPKTRKTWPVKRPDLDKLVRSTLDGLGEGGVWGDDSQVVELVARKVFPDSWHPQSMTVPGAHITISAVVDEPAPPEMRCGVHNCGLPYVFNGGCAVHGLGRVAPDLATDLYGED